ncbi:hypothetical protein MBUL_03443 [Methylobacterium bullatum]|uniref:Uncharacterized protein n=1 Tax=Methylobacterium bullatum TaxID=570505 RepID=A0A679JDX7_9HYPH|nr:hypothetical protein MBUL_03443 [Methylobacterium bullatum]
MVVAFTTAQTPDMENAYGYALRVNSLTLMPVGAPDTQKHWPATGLCFMVKPNPVRAGTTAIKQDIVVMCSASLTYPGAHYDVWEGWRPLCPTGLRKRGLAASPRFPSDLLKGDVLPTCFEVSE